MNKYELEKKIKEGGELTNEEKSELLFYFIHLAMA